MSDAVGAATRRARKLGDASLDVRLALAGEDPDWARATRMAAMAQRLANGLMALMPREEVERVSIDMLGRDPGGEE